MSAALTKIQQLMSAVLLGLASSGFAFYVLVEMNFEQYARPLWPDPAKGFTFLVHNKVGDFYGAPFEGFTSKYGVSFLVPLLLVGAVLSPEVRAGKKAADTIAARRCFLTAAILLFAVLVTLWESGF